MQTTTSVVTRHDAAVLGQIVGKSDARPHLVSSKKDYLGRLVVTAHAVKSTSSRRDRKALVQAMRGSGIDAQFRVRVHDGRSLERPQSLEGLLAHYGQEDVVHDPLAVFSRAGDLVRFARLFRSQIERPVKGIFWMGQWRTLYVVLDPKQYFDDGKVKARDLAMAEHVASEALREACGENARQFGGAIRLSFEIPSLKLVPVDAPSVERDAGWLSKLRGFAVAPAAAAVLGVAGAATAGELNKTVTQTHLADMPIDATMPAVSAVNAKFEVLGGFTDVKRSKADGVGAVGGAVAIPVAHSIGFQLDGAAGIIDDDFVGAVAGHLFWRDPAVGLFGVTGGFAHRDGSNGRRNIDVGRVGGEGELYLDAFSIEAAAGFQFSKRTKDDFYGSIDLAWYVTDNLRLDAGVSTSPVLDYKVRFGFEFQPGLDGLPGLAVFADGGFGDNGHSSVLAGFRFYFGDDKSLKRRHREDDPGNDALNFVNSGNLNY